PVGVSDARDKPAHGDPIVVSGVYAQQFESERSEAMDLNLRGKTALVTGGSKGIGLAVARLLAEEGCNLHLVARDQGRLEAAREAIRARHQVAVALHPLDLSRSEAVAELAALAGEIDILVNNAGAIP